MSEKFAEFVKNTNTVVVSSAVNNQPSSRIMRFATPVAGGNIWYVITAPTAPKATEFASNEKVAVITLPTESGAVISSNTTTIKLSDKSVADVKELFGEQIPGFLDMMPEAVLLAEVVYEITFKSAKLDTWTSHEIVEFD
ncbi:pyridoxamine 5'-phosphate oxidase family protein [Periweissella cryptocerci]|nr:pyridoxamine 5'-phosphate oxidase family protein [Periweissella cryptocerci]